jgi:hypothetical protein
MVGVDGGVCWRLAHSSGTRVFNISVSTCDYEGEAIGKEKVLRIFSLTFARFVHRGGLIAKLQK